MLIINTWPDLRAAMESCPAAGRLQPHAERLQEFDDQPLSDLCEFIIIEPTDRLADLERKLHRPLHPPPWEYVDQTDGWYELVLVTGDDGFGYVVLVEDRSDQDQDLLSYCRACMA